AHEVLAGEHDGDCRGQRFGGESRSVTSGRYDNSHLALDQISRQFRQSVVLALSRTVLNRDVLPLRITSFLQALTECTHQVHGAFNRRAPEEPNHRPRRLLRARRERPCGSHAAEQRDELAAIHSITSSERACRVGGTSKPGALAVLRLIPSSKVVGCTTGRSPGLAPPRMRPA